MGAASAGFSDDFKARNGSDETVAPLADGGPVRGDLVART
jgi:hypothetical protein